MDAVSPYGDWKNLWHQFLARVLWRWQGGQARAATRGPSMPATQQAQTQGGALHVPPHQVCHPLPCGARGVEDLARRLAQRAPPYPVCTTRLEPLRVPPGFGPDEPKAPRVLHATQGVSIDSAAIGHQPTGAE